MKKSVVSIDELSAEGIEELILLAADIKKNPGRYRERLEGKKLLLLFQKTSTRTRAAFEVGMKSLGGHTVVMDWDRSNFSISPIRYEAYFVSRVFDCVLARLIRNEDMVELATHLAIPAINGCCDLYHPSQVLADLMTIREDAGTFDTDLCYVGVHNNVANSLLIACVKMGVRLVFVTPLEDAVPGKVRALMRENGGPTPLFRKTLDVHEGIEGCRYVYTDTWINMERFGDEQYRREREERIEKLLPYQINRELIGERDIRIMHDMPVHPGYEIDTHSITDRRSIILEQAENRLYTAQAILLTLIEEEDTGVTDHNRWEGSLHE